MIKAPSAVLFDLGGVLFQYDPDHRVRFIADSAGLPPGEVEARLFDTDFIEKCDNGSLDDTQAHLEFCRQLGVDWSLEIYRSALGSAFEADGIVFGLARELSRVRDVACLSNNGQTLKRALADLHPDFASIFAGQLFFSADLGYLKPDVRAFEAVLERWGKRPDDILFVDDSTENVTIAAELGFFVHRYSDPQTLETDLRGFGLL